MLVVMVLNLQCLIEPYRFVNDPLSKLFEMRDFEGDSNVFVGSSDSDDDKFELTLN
jgi:hypothetical protein